ncbi:MAG: hypothetical protein NXH82_04050 [Rhodobacteraceae bacterium]|nr:hypothetical protein [Paracoccaceae bacterium]
MLTVSGNPVDNAALQIGFDIEYQPARTDASSLSGARAGSGQVSAGQVPQLGFDWNHVIAYGQSQSIGAATSAITTTASAYHKTFGVGPKMTKPSLADNDDDGTTKALVEDNEVNITGGQIYGETSCSGFARHAARLLSRRGPVPVFFASAAGRGGYRVDQLDPGSAWYDNLPYHAEAAHDAADDADLTHAVSFVM